MLWWVAASGVVAGVTLVTRLPEPVHQGELAAAGWTTDRVNAVSWTLTAALSAATFAGVYTLVDLRTAVAAVALALMWLPRAAPPALRAMALGGYRAGRDAALLTWLRTVRLYLAAGRPLNAAVVDAAEQVTVRAFAPVATAINRALAAARDPLAAAAPQLEGTHAAALLATVAATERSGAAGGRIIERVIESTVNSLADERSEAIERLGRQAVVVTSILSTVYTALIMVAVMATLPI